MSNLEIWKNIPIERLANYEVSNIGNMRHKKFKKNLKFYSNKGHLTWKHNIHKEKPNKNYFIHRLVAMAFLGDNPGLVVDHKNNIRNDNRVENLEWVTIQENSYRYYDNFYKRKTKRTYLSHRKIKDMYNSRKWEKAEDFYNELINTLEA